MSARNSCRPLVDQDLETPAVERALTFEKGRKYRMLLSTLAVLIGVALLVGILRHLFAG